MTSHITAAGFIRRNGDNQNASDQRPVRCIAWFSRSPNHMQNSPKNVSYAIRFGPLFCYET